MKNKKMGLKDLSKKELIGKYVSCLGNCGLQQNLLITKQIQIKHFRRRLRKIRNSIDYLLSHPFSDDVGFATKKHPRDISCNQPSKLRKKTKS